MFLPRRLPSTLKFALAERLTSASSSSLNSTLFTFSSSATIQAVSSSILRDAASGEASTAFASGWRTFRLFAVRRKRPDDTAVMVSSICFSRYSSRQSFGSG